MKNVSCSPDNFKRIQVLETIAKHLQHPNPRIVEAGAFNGTDTLRMISVWPNAVVHAFEPLPAAYKLLCHATAANPTIRTYCLALSNHCGHAPFYVSENPSKPHAPCKAGSLCRPTGRLTRSPIKYPRTILVETVTLDYWAQQHEISQIDLLWLDVQGHALSILQASPIMCARIELLYVELECIEAYHGQPVLTESLDWLKHNGFTEIGRDFTDIKTRFYGNVLLKRTGKMQ